MDVLRLRAQPPRELHQLLGRDGVGVVAAEDVLQTTQI